MVLGSGQGELRHISSPSCSQLRTAEDSWGWVLVIHAPSASSLTSEITTGNMEKVWFRGVLATSLIKIHSMSGLSSCLSAACKIPGPASFHGHYQSLFLALKRCRWLLCLGNPPQWTERLFRPEIGWTRAESHRSCKQLVGTFDQKPLWAELLLHQLQKEIVRKLIILLILY